MMTIEDIQALIANDEHRSLEIKKTTGELKDGMHTACAFLNTDGGWLIFGIAPTSLKIIGQEVTDVTQREIAQALAGLEPAVDVRVEYVPVREPNGPKVIAMHFDAFVWGKAPYTFHGCPYYKVESTTMRMPREMFEARLLTSNLKRHSWELLPAEGISLTDINQGRVLNAVQRGIEAGRITPDAAFEDVTNVLKKWRLLTADGRPNNAAALLFGTNANMYPQFMVQMARFAGTEKREFLDSTNVSGDFFELLNASTAFFFKHLFQSGKVVGFTREEHLEIPQEALREALINALCHRQWERDNLAITIAIFDDRLELSNPAVLPPDLPVEALTQSHSSHPYNPVLAEVLFQIKILEKWGTGVNRIIEACRENHIPDPVWTYEHGFLTITFKRVNHLTERQSDNASDNVNDNANDNVNDNANDNVNDNVNDRVSAILRFCLKPRSRREILEHLGLRCHSDNFNRYVKPLIDRNQLSLTLPDKPKSPKQKYITKSSIEIDV